MSKNKFAKSADEFDRRFNEGEDIHDLIDIAEELVQEIDQIRQSIGVDRAALIKIWLHERVQKEKSGIKK